ncbi:MAG: TusE/DsrC/DsvC family sulfur relay protein [Planctomycetota bacterium]|jgi:tRNA 2-thiouridine synthesizing protein E
MEKTIVTIRGREYEFDKHGYLDPPDQWDEAFAEGMAIKLGIYDGLTEEHWDFIRYLRNKFTEEKTVPFAVNACVDNKLRLKRLRYLFPKGYLRGACRIAGINFSFLADANMLLTYEDKLPDRVKHKASEMGFLDDFDKWDEQFAHEVVKAWELPDGLTENHWKIIRFLRDFYGATRTVPLIFETCRTNDVSLEELGKLFPQGYRRGACRAAGLPFFA